MRAPIEAVAAVRQGPPLGVWLFAPRGLPLDVIVGSARTVFAQRQAQTSPSTQQLQQLGCWSARRLLQAWCCEAAWKLSSLCAALGSVTRRGMASCWAVEPREWVEPVRVMPQAGVAAGTTASQGLLEAMRGYLDSNGEFQ